MIFVNKTKKTKYVIKLLLDPTLVLIYYFLKLKDILFWLFNEIQTYNKLLLPSWTVNSLWITFWIKEREGRKIKSQNTAQTTGRRCFQKIILLPSILCMCFTSSFFLGWLFWLQLDFLMIMNFTFMSSNNSSSNSQNENKKQLLSTLKKQTMT